MYVYTYTHIGMHMYIPYVWRLNRYIHMYRCIYNLLYILYTICYITYIKVMHIYTYNIYVSIRRMPLPVGRSLYSIKPPELFLPSRRPMPRSTDSGTEAESRIVANVEGPG